MAALDVTDVRVVSFSVDTIVTAPDSNTFTALANLRYGVPDKATSMTVSLTTPVMCMTDGAYSPRDDNVFQVFTVNEVRTPA